MWRAIPLLKMVFRMLGLSIGLFLAAQVVVQAAIGRSYLQLDIFTITYVVSVEGAKIALSLAIPMLLVTLVFFRDIRRPTFYRFTMLTIALISTIVIWLGPILEVWRSVLGQVRTIDVHLIIMTIFFALLTLMSNSVAGAYIRESRQRQLRHQEQVTDSANRSL